MHFRDSPRNPNYTTHSGFVSKLVCKDMARQQRQMFQRFTAHTSGGLLCNRFPCENLRSLNLYPH